jgi:hypothetical protein
MRIVVGLAGGSRNLHEQSDTQDFFAEAGVEVRCEAQSCPSVIPAVQVA